MGLLVTTGRFLVGIAAIFVVILSTAFGIWSGAQQSGADVVLGAVIGGLAGLVSAGCAFGALAALFQIATNTEAMLRATEEANSRASHYYTAQLDLLGEMMRSSERAASALEKAEWRAKRANDGSASGAHP